MPRRQRMTPTRNPMASRRGFLAFIVDGLEFQTYFDPTTMTTFGLGQDDRPVRVRRYPEGRAPFNLKRETMRVENARRRGRMELKGQIRRKANPESRMSRVKRGGY